MLGKMLSLGAYQTYERFQKVLKHTSTSSYDRVNNNLIVDDVDMCYGDVRTPWLSRLGNNDSWC